MKKVIKTKKSEKVRLKGFFPGGIYWMLDQYVNSFIPAMVFEALQQHASLRLVDYCKLKTLLNIVKNIVITWSCSASCPIAKLTHLFLLWSDSFQFSKWSWLCWKQLFKQCHPPHWPLVTACLCWTTRTPASLLLSSSPPGKYSRSPHSLTLTSSSSIKYSGVSPFPSVTE